jgi:hypothetical protein
MRPAEHTRAVFAHQTIEGEIEDQQHSEKHQNFDGTPLRRVLHQPGPSSLAFLPYRFRLFDFAEFAFRQVHIERMPAIAAAQPLTSPPVVYKIQPRLFARRSRILTSALWTLHGLPTPRKEEFDASRPAGGADTKDRSLTANAPSART